MAFVDVGVWRRFLCTFIIDLWLYSCISFTVAIRVNMNSSSQPNHVNVQQCAAVPLCNIPEKSGNIEVESNFKEQEVQEEYFQEDEDIYSKSAVFCEEKMEVPSSDHVAEIVGKQGLYRYFTCYRFA